MQFRSEAALSRMPLLRGNKSRELLWEWIDLKYPPVVDSDEEEEDEEEDDDGTPRDQFGQEARGLGGLPVASPPVPEEHKHVRNLLKRFLKSTTEATQTSLSQMLVP